MDLYYYPLSRYCQKVLIAAYEKRVIFSPIVINLRDPIVRSKFLTQFPMGQLPILKDMDDNFLPNATIIIEYLDNTFATGIQLLSFDAETLLDIKLYDRLIDSEINDRLFKIDNINDTGVPLPNHIQIKREEKHIYNQLQDIDNKLQKSDWLCGDDFSLADCALIPCLRHPWVQNHLTTFENLARYQLQAESRSSWMLAQDEIEFAEAEDLIALNQIP